MSVCSLSSPHNVCLVSLSRCVRCRPVGLLQSGHGGGDEAVQLLPVTRLQEPLVELDLHELLEVTLLLPGGREGEKTSVTAETQQQGQC